MMYFYFSLLCGIFLRGTVAWSWDRGLKVTQWGFRSYTKYEPGDMNLIITAPHGGKLNPLRLSNGAGWPYRKAYGCKGSNGKCIWTGSCRSRSKMCKTGIMNDLYTQRIARDIADGIKRITGSRPHVVYNMLRRSKLDANREINEATFNIPDAITAYRDYHRFISKAKSALSGPGLLLDIHGQAHKPERTELGYLISRRNLNSGNYIRGVTSIKSLGEHWCGSILSSVSPEYFRSGRDSACFKEFIIGKKSLGYFMNLERLKAVPSPQNKKPNGEKYFSGGYTVKKYGSRDGGNIDGIQMEFPKTLRRRWGSKQKESVARAIVRFWKLNYELLSNGDI